MSEARVLTCPGQGECWESSPHWHELVGATDVVHPGQTPTPPAEHDEYNAGCTICNPDGTTDYTRTNVAGRVWEQEFNFDFYMAISQLLYDLGVGEHLETQIRAAYRRDLSAALYKRLKDKGYVNVLL
jgi:hypothetical protein